MDSRDATSKNKKKRVSSSDDQVPEVEEGAKRSSFPPGSEADFSSIVLAHLFSQPQPDEIHHLIQQRVVERFFVEQWPQMEPWFRQVICEVTNSLIKSHVDNLVLGKRGEDEIGKYINTRAGRSAWRLRFSSRIAAEIFTNNKIRDEKGEALKVELICDVGSSMAPSPLLLNAQIELFILENNTEKFGSSNQREDEIYWTLSDFKANILSPRDGKRPLIIGTDVKLYLENGVGSMENLTVTDNSSWTKTKCFRLGAKIIDNNILADFPRIQEAVSQPFQVKDHRGEVNKKHHPPSWEDPVWRLEGIGKGGVYHTNLSNQGIYTVGDFLIALWRNANHLRMLLGQRVLDSTWNKMIENAQECVDVPSTYNQSSKTDFVETNNQVLHEEPFNDNFLADELPYFCEDQPRMSMVNFNDLVTPNGEASTSHEPDYTNTQSGNTYYQGVEPSYCPNPPHPNIRP